MDGISNHRTGAGMTDSPEWQIALGAYAAAGIRTFPKDDILPSGIVYEARQVALGDGFGPWMSLHDLGHYLAAPAERKDLPNFGLGPSGSTPETRRAPRAIAEEAVLREESMACLFHALLVEHLAGRREALAVCSCLNAPWTAWDTVVETPTLREAEARGVLFWSPLGIEGHRLRAEALPLGLATFLRRHRVGTNRLRAVPTRPRPS